MRETLLTVLGISVVAIAAIVLTFLEGISAETEVQNRIPYVKSKVINVMDGSLDDWKGISPLYVLTSKNQWENIRGRKPETTTGSEDIFAKLFLSWDEKFLYFAVDVIDDKVLLTSEKPWSGDCAEIFFVGFDSQLMTDYHKLVEQSAEGYKNVFQLVVSGSKKQMDPLPTWRTDRSTIKALNDHGFSAIGWKTDKGWQAEAKIPLAPLGDGLKISESSKIVKIGFDILDYDQQIAPDNETYDWGYYPDNVLSNSSTEAEVNQPYKMKKFVFQKE